MSTITFLHLHAQCVCSSIDSYNDKDRVTTGRFSLSHVMRKVGIEVEPVQHVVRADQNLYSIRRGCPPRAAALSFHLFGCSWYQRLFGEQINESFPKPVLEIVFGEQINKSSPKPVPPPPEPSLQLHFPPAASLLSDRQSLLPTLGGQQIWR